MKLAIRICAYLLLLLLAGDSFGRFRRAYSEGGHVRNFEVQETNAAMASAVTPAPGSDPAETNSPAATSSSDSSTTNNVAGTPPAKTAESTNAAPAVPPQAANKKAPRKADSMLYLGLFVFSMVGLGGLGAWDVARFLGGRAGKAVMAEDWVEKKDPGYEKAEEEWARGNHLEAVNLMREYLKKNPGEQHVAIRIAEIYEKDLGNFLAAALELEEVLTKKLPREKWGWTAIRLSNLYSGKLNKTDTAMALLERIVTEYPETGAAKKARQRLGLPEPEDAVTPEETDAPDSGGAEPPPPPDPDNPSLPKGFRPKK